MIYLDTSAACKLVLPELHSAALVEWLDSRPAEPVVSSVLIEVELVRAVRRVAPDRVQDARDALRFVNRVGLDAEIIRRAADFPEGVSERSTRFTWPLRSNSASRSAGRSASS